MTYVVTDACIKCKYMDCVEVCPVDCFYEGESHAGHQPQRMHRLRRVRARVPGRSDPSRYRERTEKWLELNSSFSADWPNITRKKDSPADADEHKGEEGKYDKYFTPDRRRWRLRPWRRMSPAAISSATKHPEAVRVETLDTQGNARAPI